MYIVCIVQKNASKAEAIAAKHSNKLIDNAMSMESNTPVDPRVQASILTARQPSKINANAHKNELLSIVICSIPLKCICARF